jgi:hypothetical protein
VHQFHADDAQAALFKPFDDVSRQPALDGIRLDDNQSTFHVAYPLRQKNAAQVPAGYDTRIRWKKNRQIRALPVFFNGS